MKTNIEKLTRNPRYGFIFLKRVSKGSISNMQEPNKVKIPNITGSTTKPNNCITTYANLLSSSICLYFILYKLTCKNNIIKEYNFNQRFPGPNP